MSISPMMSSGLQGLVAGINRTEGSAGKIAMNSQGSDTESFTASMIGLKAGEIQVKAAAAVVKSADEILGSIINIRA